MAASEGEAARGGIVGAEASDLPGRAGLGGDAVVLGFGLADGYLGCLDGGGGASVARLGFVAPPAAQFIASLSQGVPAVADALRSAGRGPHRGVAGSDDAA
ncbi:MAG: hypothetical protein K2Z25_15380 [Beijerinckiaceae bacterium]|nr:hypothetical protein [Beijerinckiaceae bacterium]